MAKNRKSFLEDYLYADEFEYDFKKDPLYEAMKKQYLQEAERTAEDVLGKYSAASGGGTPSSAAVAAASNAANQQKSKLNEALPTLYDLAWDMYRDELENKKSKYEAVLGYDKFMESVGSAGDFFDFYEKEDEDGSKTDENTNGTDSNEDEQKWEYDEEYYDKLTQTSAKNPLKGEKKMDDVVFDTMKTVIQNYAKSGNLKAAQDVYNKYIHSMSQAQRSLIEKMLNGN